MTKEQFRELLKYLLSKITRESAEFNNWDIPDHRHFNGGLKATGTEKKGRA